jgi:TIR domain
MGEQAQEASNLALSEPVSTAVQQACRPETPDGARLRVFISYSRNDVAFAEQLASALNPCGFECQMDHHSISGGEEWKQRLGEADTIIFVLSPDSAASEMCAWEVEEAVRINKRIIPIICRPLEGMNPPSRLRDLQYILFHLDPKTPGSGFGTGLANLVTVLNTDFAWMREHTRYFQRATEWNARGRPANRLLSGDDIGEAKAWAARRPKSATQPTALHLDFIRASEQEAEARSSEQRKQLETMAAAQVEREKALHQAEQALKQAADAQRKRASIRIALVVVSVLLVVAGSLGWGAEQKRRIAEQQRETAEQLVKQREAAEQYRKDAERRKEETDTIRDRAREFVAQDKDPAKVRQWLEYAEKGSVEPKTAPGEEPAKGPDAIEGAHGEVPKDYKAPEPSEKATAKGNKNARFKPLSTSSRAAFWRWWGSHLAIEAKVSPASHRATASVHW